MSVVVFIGWRDHHPPGYVCETVSDAWPGFSGWAVLYR